MSMTYTGVNGEKEVSCQGLTVNKGGTAEWNFSLWSLVFTGDKGFFMLKESPYFWYSQPHNIDFKRRDDSHGKRQEIS